MTFNTKNKFINKGFVLIYVISIVAFIASALVLFQASSMTFTKKLDTLFKEVDALYMAYSPVILSRAIIKDDSSKGIQDGVGDNWFSFREPRTFPVEGGEISMMMNDAGAVPDINALFTGQNIKDNALMLVMQKYFTKLGVSKNFAGKLKDWIDPDNRPNNFGGAEYPAVTGAVMANENILSPADIRFIKNYSTDMEVLFGNSVSYLPSAAPVNINTVSPLFLSVLFAGTSARINHVTAQRERQIFTALGDFYQALGIDKVTKAVELGSQTTYFTTQAQINMHGVEKKVEALFERRLGKIVLRRLLWN